MPPCQGGILHNGPVPLVAEELHRPAGFLPVEPEIDLLADRDLEPALPRQDGLRPDPQPFLRRTDRRDEETGGEAGRRRDSLPTHFSFLLSPRVVTRLGGCLGGAGIARGTARLPPAGPAPSLADPIRFGRAADPLGETTPDRSAPRMSPDIARRGGRAGDGPAPMPGRGEIPQRL